MFKKLILIAAVLLFAAAVVFVPFGNDEIKLKRSSDNMRVRYVDAANVPRRTIQASYRYMTEYEVFLKYNSLIFCGTIKRIRNLELDFDGDLDYHSLILIEVDEVIRGDIQRGDVLAVEYGRLIGEDTQGLPMRTRMNGISTIVNTDPSWYYQRGRASLCYIDIAEYTFIHVNLGTYLDTPEGVFFYPFMYDGLTDPQTLDDVKEYIIKIIS